MAWNWIDGHTSVGGDQDSLQVLHSEFRHGCSYRLTGWSGKAAYSSIPDACGAKLRDSIKTQIHSCVYMGVFDPGGTVLVEGGDALAGTGQSPDLLDQLSP